MDWVRYKPVILPVSTNSIINYNGVITVAWEEGMNPDFSDISLIDNDGVTPVAQYRFSYVEGVSSIWWFRVPSKEAAGRTIYLLFDNVAAILRSNKSEVFLLEDEGGLINDLETSGKWTVLNPNYTYKHDGYIEVDSYENQSPYDGSITSVLKFGVGAGFYVRAKLMEATSAYFGMFIGFVLGTVYSVLSHINTKRYYFRATFESATAWTVDKEVELMVIRKSDTEFKFYKDGILEKTVTAASWTEDANIQVRVSGPEVRVYDIFAFITSGSLDNITPGESADTMDVWGTETMLNEYIDDISFRIENPKGNRWQYYPHIQRTLQRLYWRLCKEYRLVKDSLEMDFSTLGTFVAYWTLPRWFMKLYKLDPDCDWREPDEFDPTEPNTYTIDGGKIYFGGIDATSVITMYFYSSGKVFVTKADADLLAGEINVPEWTDRALDQALYYGACIELKQNYPGFQHDVNEYNEMKNKMADSFDSDQDKDLVLPGDPAPGTPDAYGWVN